MIDPKNFKNAKLLVHLGNAIVSLRNEKMKELDLTSSQSDVIVYLLRNTDRKVSTKELLDDLSLSPSTMAGILKRLEQKNLISRETDSKDSRKILISLTEQGIATENHLRINALKTENVITKGMSETEINEFNRLLNIAVENVNDEKNS